MSTRSLIHALALVATITPSVAIAADLKPDVTFVRHHFDGWMMAPATQAGRIVGFLAWEIEGAAHGENIDLIWLERDDTSNWSAWGWSNVDKGAAVNWVRQVYADTTLFDRDGTLVVASLHGITIAPTDKLDGAFFESDPLAASVNSSPDAAAIAATLAGTGYSVTAGEMATAMSSQPCDAAISTLDKMMTPILRQVEDALFTAKSLATERAAAPPDPCISWPCPGCTAAYGTWTTTGPTVTTVTAMGNRCKCESRTPASASVTYTGETWFWCNSCPAPGTATGEEYCAEDVECSVPITATPCPGGGCGLFVP